MKQSKFSTVKLDEGHAQHRDGLPWLVTETNEEKYPEKPHNFLTNHASRTAAREFIKTVKSFNEEPSAPVEPNPTDTIDVSPESDRAIKPKDGPAEDEIAVTDTETGEVFVTPVSEKERLAEKEIVLTPKAELLPPIEETNNRKCVAVVYPESPGYDLTETQIAELDKKYSHLRQLDVDDKKGYEELGDAIKDVKKHRTENQAQENTIKAPLNAFRAKVLEVGQSLRSQVSLIEDALKAEKTRIDDIRQEREAAQRMLWAKNLGVVQKLMVLENPTIDSLANRLAIIEGFDIESLDFGEMIEDAKSALANAHMQIKQSLAVEQRAAQMAEEKRQREAEQAKKDAEQKRRDEEQAAKDKAAAEQMAEMQKQMAEIQRQLAEEKAKNEPAKDATPPASVFDEEPEAATPEIEEPTPVISMSTSRNSGRQYSNNASEIATKKAVEQTEVEAVTQDTEDQDDGANDVPVISDNDIRGVGIIANKLKKIATEALEYNWDSEDVFDGVSRVSDNVGKMVDFLNKMQTSAEGTK